MNILVINSGSSSLKFQLLDTELGSAIEKGEIERIGIQGGTCADHKAAIKEVFLQIKNSPIDAIGHRVVHGGETFKQSAIVTQETLAEVEKISHLAPLHNPANLMGVRACMEVMPKTPNVMVFDTSFHAHMPSKSYLYALPLDDYKKHGIRRYGFHGTSHNYVSRKCAEMYGKPREQMKIITCHLGNGCSIAAINHGASVDTSMGLTPLEGLVMGTRSGDIDPAAVQYIAAAHKLDLAGVTNYLNKQCGLKGLCGYSDMRDLANAAKGGDESCRTAVSVFIHRIIKYIGAYAAVMNGVDAIVWTGGIGNNKPYVRKKVAEHLAFIGANIDPEKNLEHEDRGSTGEITAPGARVRTFIIKTNEELEIAHETAKLVFPGN